MEQADIACWLFTGCGLTTKETYQKLAVDIKPANRLGSAAMRTRQTVIEDILARHGVLEKKHIEKPPFRCIK